MILNLLARGSRTFFGRSFSSHKNAVDSVTDSHPVFCRLEVDVTRRFPDRQVYDAVRES